MKKYTIADLAEGKCILINDGTEEQLIGVLQKAFPEDDGWKNKVWLKYKFYVCSSNTNHWTMSKEISECLDAAVGLLPTQSVVDFLEEVWVPKTGERVLVSDDNRNWEERIFIKKIDDSWPIRVIAHTNEKEYERTGCIPSNLGMWLYVKPLEFPKKWCIKVEKQEVADYCNEYGESPPYVVGKHYAHFPAVRRGVTTTASPYNGYTEITFEQFQKYVLKNQEKPMKDYTITSIQAQEIFNAACGEWKEKLAQKWSKNILYGNNIEISEEFYKEMRGACTPTQHQLFDKIFGFVEINLRNPSTINDLKVYEEYGGVDSSLMAIRDFKEYKDKSIFLNPGYNWEIKTDSNGALCLIPTKKQ